MDAINSFISWLFTIRLALFLVLGGIYLLFCAWTQNKKDVFQPQKDDEDWDLFGWSEEGWSDFEEDNK